ncbi:MAG: YihY/virulence factor BrkB family protein [Oscillospiraceae bacterium]|nr:YihY/virulence factor BrkB family protein [Oscillospiraceae bacterium]
MRRIRTDRIGITSVIRQLVSRSGEANTGVYAANASFFMILSVFPLLVLVMAVLDLTSLTDSDLMEMISFVLPSALVPFAATLVDSIPGLGGATIISLTAVLAIWSASRGVYGVLVGINAIFHCQDRRPYLVKRAICIVYTMLLVLNLLLTLGLHVFGRTLFNSLLKHLPAFSDAIGTVMVLRFVFTVIVLSLTFTAIYAVFPSRHVSLRVCFLSAFLASLGWLIFSSVFSVVVTHSKNYTTFYGSLAMVAVSMLWIYSCMTILLMGGVLASILDPGSHERASNS